MAPTKIHWDWWHRRKHPAWTGSIRQVNLEEDDVPITGIVAGGKGTFKVTWNGSIASGALTSWTASDATLTLVVDAADATGQTVVVDVPAADTGTSFTLTATVMNSVAVSITAVATVPITQAAATSGVIDQIA